ncbi:MAG: hypothetical protein HFJ43_05100 [Clostridia bacterium]|nr:hypothetical protein [Clostridia bacterium]
MKIIIIVISGIILLGSLLGEVFIYEFSTTVLSKRYILEKFDENNYYDNLYSNIVNEMEGYIGPSGLDENIFDNIITKEKIEQDVNIVVSNIYESKNADIDTKIIRQKLDENINNYLKKENLKLEDTSSLDEFKDQIIDVYKTEVSYNTYTKYIKNINLNKIVKLFKIAKKVFLIGIIIPIVIIVLLNTKKIEKVIPEIMTFILACGTILIVISKYITMRVNIEAITFLNTAFSIVIRDIAITVLNDVLSIGIVFVAFSILLIIINNIVDAIKYT